MTDRRTRTRLIALNATPRLGRPAIYRLAERLAERLTEQPSWVDAPGSDLELALNVGVPVEAVRRARAGLARAEESAAREEELASQAGGRILVRGEADYPPALETLPLPPPVLALRGALSTLGGAPALAIVGSRRPDDYGIEVTESFAAALAAAGLVIVSGFARGIDAAAHQAALTAPGGATVAVLGCGLAVDYPRGHRTLAREVERRGALLSEFPSGAQPRPWHFPLRNRTIAALSSGVLVVRAAPRSGSLITARHALDLGKTVWAVPGSIFDELSLGPNALLRAGATPALHPRDLLDELLPDRPRAETAPAIAPAVVPPSGLAAQRELGFASGPTCESGESGENLPEGLHGLLFAAIPRAASDGAISAEELALRTATPVDRVLGALLDLEIEGRIRKLPGFGYAR